MARFMKLVLGGREWRCAAVELADPTIRESREIKAHTGMRIPEWEQAVTKDLHRMDADTFLVLAYLVQTRSVEPFDRILPDDFDWTSLNDMSALTLVQSFSLVDEPDKPVEPAAEAVSVEPGEPASAVKGAKHGRAKQPAAAPG